MWYERYKQYIPDLPSFKKMLTSPLPQNFWVNSLKANSDAVQSWLHDEGIKYTQSQLLPNTFAVSDNVSLGNHPLYRAGVIHIQEAVSMLPALLLKPQAGDKILDMCAAPGNKMALMAVQMQQKGVVIGNDCRMPRLRSTGKIIKRLGLANVALTLYDAQQYPAPDCCFDKILVDAPCSCEGTFRKNIKREFPEISLGQRRYLTQVQYNCLKQAIRMCKAGGQILYSTCTFAAEENECIIQKILDKHADDVEVQPLGLTGWQYQHGWENWQGQSFHADIVQHAVRIWPHQNNTGGFFMCLLRKKPSSCAASVIQNDISDNWRVLPHLTADVSKITQLDDYYRLHNKTQSFHYLTSKRAVFAVSKDMQIPRHVKCDTVGVMVLKNKCRYPKFSTSGAHFFGAQANNRVVDLQTEQQYNAYVRREAAQGHWQQPEGFVLVFYRGVCLGHGLLKKHENAMLLVSLYPLDDVLPSQVTDIDTSVLS